MRTSEIVLRYVIAQRGEAVMLLKPKITCQAPYGAFDQKINYQYNLLRATLITVAFVAVLLGALFVGAAPTKPPLGSSEGVTTRQFDGDSIYVVINLPLGNGHQTPPTRPVVPTSTKSLRGIPVPVAIEDWLDDADSVDTSLVGEVDVGSLIYTGAGSAGGNLAHSGGRRGGSRFPTITEFIPHEIAPRGLE